MDCQVQASKPNPGFIDKRPWLSILATWGRWFCQGKQGFDLKYQRHFYWVHRGIEGTQSSNSKVQRPWSYHLPSGKLTQKAIENGPVEIVDFPIQNGGSFHSYVSHYQRVGCLSYRLEQPGFFFGASTEPQRVHH